MTCRNSGQSIYNKITTRIFQNYEAEKQRKNNRLRCIVVRKKRFKKRKKTTRCLILYNF